MNQRRHLYESTFIVNASLDDPQIEVIVEKVKEFITKNGSEIKDLYKWGRKRFTYSIKKKNNGFYVVMELDAPAEFPQKLDRFYLLDENILRFLTIKLDKHALKHRLKVSDLAKQSTMELTPGTEPVVEPTPEPVTAAIKE